ncbi:MAG: hemerythrin domain-containing protein [Kiloniellales bacterium]
MSKALHTIKTEHKNYARVLACLARVLDGLGARSEPEHRELLFMILDYIEAFPATFHHPKEDQYLFVALRRRRPETAPLIDRVADEHAQSLDLLADFRAACDAYRGDPATLANVREAGRRYHGFEQAHMLREEAEVLPLASEALTEADWCEIDAAFARNDDPLFGSLRAAQFDRLFRWILEAAWDIATSGADPPTHVENPVERIPAS